ncbi:MAG: TM2 domain-containing protein [Alphaproteobacteria bacterium]|nr:TM2 domain-containing protein [Alphaproteobacteria bacterium]
MTHGAAQVMMRYDANKRSAGIAYLLWFFLGSLGAHRFYLKHTGSALAMLLIFLGSLALTVVAIGVFGLIVVGIWALVDAFLIPGMARDYNNRLISNLGM